MSQRSRLLKPLVMAAGLAAILPALGSAQGVAPHRKSGMWETSMNVGGRAITTGLCTDESIERRYSVVNPQQMGARDCTGMTPQPVPGGYRMEGTCSNGGRTTHIVATIKGDFNSAYSMDLVSDVNGKAAPPIHMDAKWTGACPAGRNPGDMVMPGGVVMNIDALAGTGAGAGGH